MERRVFALPDAAFAAAFSRYNHRAFEFPFSVADDDGLLRIDQGDEHIYVGRAPRVLFFRKGLAYRRQWLSHEYFLERAPILPNELVIDVGANVGEVSMIAADMGARIIAVEPEPVEAAALRRNLSGAQAVIVGQALWHEETRRPFYSRNGSGDSSLFAMERPDSVALVVTTTLDAVYADHGHGQRVKFLKLEAEGAEPEILDGARNMLRFTDFVSVDVGPERGVERENTLIAVLERMRAADFEPIAFGHRRCVLLFRRENLNVSHKCNAKASDA